MTAVRLNYQSGSGRVGHAAKLSLMIGGWDQQLRPSWFEPREMTLEMCAPLMELPLASTLGLKLASMLGLKLASTLGLALAALRRIRWPACRGRGPFAPLQLEAKVFEVQLVALLE